MDMYAEYFDAVYGRANQLTPEEYDRGAVYFAAIYRGRLPSDKAARILDIGCGAGQFLYFCKQQGYLHAEGIDVSPQQIEACRAHTKAEVRQADAFDFLDGKNGVYDLIVAHDVIEHVAKERVVLLMQKIHAALRPGGVCIVRVPNMSNPFAAHGRYIDLTHELGFTERSMYQLLFMGGFRDISMTGGMLIMRRSLRSMLRRIFLKVYYAWVKFLYYVQDLSVPRVLDNDLIAFARKADGDK